MEGYVEVNSKSVKRELKSTFLITLTNMYNEYKKSVQTNRLLMFGRNFVASFLLIFHVKYCISDGPLWV